MVVVLGGFPSMNRMRCASSVDLSAACVSADRSSGSESYPRKVKALSDSSASESVLSSSPDVAATWDAFSEDAGLSGVGGGGGVTCSLSASVFAAVRRPDGGFPLVAGDSVALGMALIVHLLEAARQSSSV
jgi:hypothetical protein